LQNFGNIERHGDMEMKTWKHGEWRHEDMETWRHGNLTFYEKKQIEDRKQKLSNGLNGLNGPNRFAHLCMDISMFFERGLGGPEGNFFWEGR
jgi:hypothetical protein